MKEAEECAMDGAVFTRRFGELIFEGNSKEAELLLDGYRTIGAPQDYRITQAEKLLNDVRRFESSRVDGTRKVKLRQFEQTDVTEIHDINDVLSNPPGEYVFGDRRERPSSFEEDFAGLDDHVKRKLEQSGFGIGITESNVETVRVFNGAVFCVEDRDLLTCATYEGEYDRRAASRVAKVSSINYTRDPKYFIDRAIVLPAPHHVSNYYHVLTETAYYLRFAENNDNIIIHPEDVFGVIGFIADKLGVSSSRLFEYKDVKETFVYKAAMPIPSGFYWSRGLYRFFGERLPVPAGEYRKIYISRSLRGRGPDNEKEIESFLEARGFRIVHAEKLPLAEQASIMKGADVIVAPHGAGLANLAYARPGTALIELFGSNFINRDFYLRSRNNDLNYFPIVFDGVLNVSDVQAALAEVGVDKV